MPQEAHEVVSKPKNPVEILKDKVGEAILTPQKYLPENSLPGIECQKDKKTGLPIFEGKARIQIIEEMSDVIKQGGDVVIWLYDGDGLKEANDKVSHEFGDAIITWGASFPLHELEKLDLKCRVIAMRPEGSPDDTLVFFENPSADDGGKIIELNRKLNNPATSIDLDIRDNEGKARTHSLSVTGGLAFYPKDEREVARRHRRLGIDNSPDFSTFTEGQITDDIANSKENDPEGYKFTIIEGLRQIADDRAHEAKGAKQLEQAMIFLETLRGLTLRDYDKAVRKRFSGTRTSEVTQELIDTTRIERFLPGM